MSTHPIWIIFLASLFYIQLAGQETQVFSLIEDQTDPYFGALEFVPTAELAEFQHLSPENWQKILKLYPVQPTGGDYSTLPPMLGEVILANDQVCFVPRFPFMQGKSYRLHLDLKQGFKLMQKQWPKGREVLYQQLIDIPALEPKETTFVENVYPSTPNWPANQLKFYIYFSAPMRFGEAFKYIQLHDENGMQIEHAFLLVEQELWDQDRKRLTVWFDPGRIKRGLIPNLELGPPLEPGKKYVLTICKEWEDLNGRMLDQTFVKEIRVGPADREMPAPKTWTVHSPNQGTTEPLKLLFNEPMDYALMQSAVVVMNENGHIVEGQIQTLAEEQQWFFFPNLPWDATNYKIRISHDLEDLAGNNLHRLFDTEPKLSNKNPGSVLSAYIDLTFYTVKVQPKK